MLTNQKRCDLILASLFPNQQDLIERWWTSPNKAFGEITPEQMFAKDEQVVVKYLYAQISGDYS
jgi:hypothetical protein